MRSSARKEKLIVCLDCCIYVPNWGGVRGVAASFKLQDLSKAIWKGLLLLILAKILLLVKLYPIAISAVLQRCLFMKISIGEIKTFFYMEKPDSILGLISPS